MILHSQQFGSGFPFVILHGFLGTGDNWKSMGLQLAEDGFEVHLVDQRNHGRSFHDVGFSYELMANDLLAYCDVHGIKEMILLGHSMGGKTAMEFATKNPKRVKALIVADIGPKSYPQHHQDILKGLSSLDFSVIKSRGEADDLLSAYVPNIGVRQFLLKNLYWVDKGVLGLRMNLPVLIDKIEEVGKSLDAEATYDGPTLFLGGENSGYIQPMDELLIMKHFPKATIEKVSNAGHWLHAENPSEFYHKIKVFLDGFGEL